MAVMQEAQRLVAKAKEAAGGGGWGSSTVDQELAHSVEYYQSVIERALEKANKENASLYFQRIPSSPPQLQAASLVNPIPPEGRELLDRADVGFKGALWHHGCCPYQFVTGPTSDEPYAKQLSRPVIPLSPSIDRGYGWLRKEG